jgi:hypothetical protein
MKRFDAESADEGGADGSLRERSGLLAPARDKTLGYTPGTLTP